VNPRLRAAARAAIGFMPESEGLRLYEAGLAGATHGPLLEIGTYCGKSAIYLGGAAAEASTVLFSIDHHRGSEEHQRGEEFHNPRLWDEEAGAVDTLPHFRRAIRGAGLEEVVVAVVGRSETVAGYWSTPLGLVFVDGGHAEDTVRADIDNWAPHVAPGGLLVVHDVFADPDDGGQGPYHAYRRALGRGSFEEAGGEGSLRLLRRKP
jgi:MMP 1-O-methyltransferase